VAVTGRCTVQVCPPESEFLEAFIVKPRRQRELEPLASSKNRHKFTSKFDHHGRDYVIPECIRPIELRYEHSPDIADILRAIGAPETCHDISGERDGEDIELLTALKQIVGYGTGTVLSCIPGKLAYFEGDIREGCCRLDSANKLPSLHQKSENVTIAHQS
jgi:hypothetical protein